MMYEKKILAKQWKLRANRDSKWYQEFLPEFYRKAGPSRYNTNSLAQSALEME